MNQRRNKAEINQLRIHSRRVVEHSHKLESGAIEQFDIRLGPKGTFMIWTVTMADRNNDICEIMVPTSNNWRETFLALGIPELEELQEAI